MKLCGFAASAAALQAAVDAVVGCPQRWTVVGGPNPYSAAFFAGALGWTRHACALPVADGSGAAYVADVPDGSGWTPERRLIIAIGESGMAGRGDPASGLPTGYPPLGGLSMFDDNHTWRTLSEPVEQPLAQHVTSALYDSAAGVGWGGLLSWHIQRELGPGVEVGLVSCARGGSMADSWLPAATGLYAETLAKVRAALAARPGATVECILLDQGVNDGRSAGATWAARWTTIEAALRSDLSLPDVPIFYAKQMATAPIDMDQADWNQSLLAYDAWQSAKRIMVTKPDGPTQDGGYHLTTAANVVFASSAFAAWKAYRATKRPWASPGRIIIAGQSNAQLIANATPAPSVRSNSTDITLVAAGATSLYSHWQPGQPLGLREALVDAVASAPVGKSVVILWSQGEADQAKDGDQGSATYVADFTALYNQVNGSRTDVLWVVCYLSANTRFGPSSRIRLAQEQLVAQLPNLVAINTDSYEIEPGLLVHYTNNGAVAAWRAALQLADAQAPT